MKTTITAKLRLYYSVVIMLVPAVMVVIVPGAFARVMYSVTDLGTLSRGIFSMAAGINNHGHVVGTADYHAFLYSNGHMTDLGTLPGGNYSHALAINDNGQIIGYSGISGGQERAFLYAGGRMTSLGASMPTPVDINNNGQMVGFTFGLHAFLYSNGVLTDLGSSTRGAYAINNNAQVAGQNAASHAFLYSGGVITDLGTLGGMESCATGINDLGQVVGYSYPAGNTGWHAFLYDSGHMTDLGIFPGGSGFYIQAYAINNVGQAVGTADNHAFLYRGGGIVDLNTLIPRGTGWSLSTANAINDYGQIVGTGFNPSGQQHAFLLTPLPDPPPTITCSTPLVLECTNGGGIGTVSANVQDTNGNALEVVWTVDGTPYKTNYIPSGGTVTFSNLTFTAQFGLGEHLVVVSASNGKINPATCSTTVTVRDTTPPTISCPADVTVSANTDCSATTVNLRLPVVNDNCGAASVTNNAPASYPLGTNLVTWTATDGSGNSASCVQRVNVRDTTPPQIVRIEATPSLLWPPNHRMIPISVIVDTVDNCDPSPVVRIMHVTSNEPQNPPAADWEITGTRSVNLRAERLGRGAGRLYTIVVQCEDGSGNVSFAFVEVRVPHDNK